MRTETLREEIGTIIQAGHIDRLTSDEIAGQVLAWIEYRRINP